MLLNQPEQVFLFLLSSLLQFDLLVCLVYQVLQVVASEGLDQVKLEFECHDSKIDWFALLAILSNINIPHLPEQAKYTLQLPSVHRRIEVDDLQHSLMALFLLGLVLENRLVLLHHLVECVSLSLLRDRLIPAKVEHSLASSGFGNLDKRVLVVILPNVVFLSQHSIRKYAVEYYHIGHWNK